MATDVLFHRPAPVSRISIVWRGSGRLASGYLGIGQTREVFARSRIRSVYFGFARVLYHMHLSTISYFLLLYGREDFSSIFVGNFWRIFYELRRNFSKWLVCVPPMAFKRTESAHRVWIGAL